MSNLYRLVFASLLAAVTASAPLAAFRVSSSPFPVCWQGFYLNGQLGMGEDREHITFTNSNYFNTLGSTTLGSHYKCVAEGVVGGGAVGYHYQWDSLVMGVEVGALSTNFKKSRPSPFFPSSDIFSSHLQCVASAKFRLGYAYDSLLTYITGGWAGGDERITLTDTLSRTRAHTRTWSNGWTAGIGFDCKCVEWLSLGLAYDYTQLESSGTTASCKRCGAAPGLDAPKLDKRCTIQAITLRLNYYFDT